MSVDLTTAQRDIVDRMIEQASKAEGMPISVSTREFFHALLTMGSCAAVEEDLKAASKLLSVRKQTPVLRLEPRRAREG